MGTKNNKVIAKGAKPSTAPNNDTPPLFDEKAFVALTAKIEKSFENEESQQPLSNAANGESNLAKSSQGLKQTGGDPSSRKNFLNLTHGTKRDANGNAKRGHKGSAKSKGHSAGQNMGKDKDDRAMLLQEILALGGTEEDLDLVADAVSDDDDIQETRPLPNKAFQKDVAKFVAGLGFEDKMTENGGESDEDVDDEVEEVWDDTAELESSGMSMSHVEPQASTGISPGASTSKDSNRLVFDARPDWHAASLPALPILEVGDASKYREAIASLKDYAVSLLEADASLYASRHLASSSSHRFLSTIMSSGTLSDKVSALTLVIQESPVHTCKSFESLLTLAKKRSRGQAVSALAALKDLLGSGVVLPADRRLRSFASQPGLIATLQKTSIASWKAGQMLPGSITKAQLISWSYEDWLKESYFDMLKVLENWCNDEVEYARSRAVTYVYELLKEKPEQEANLLRLLVNKLGDPDKKIASRTSYLLLQLQTSHPLMKPIIVRSIENELLLRPGQSLHAKYYAINTLNQTILSGKEEEVAKKLLDIYFDLFAALLRRPDPQKATVAEIVVNRKGQVQGGGAPKGKKAKTKAAQKEDAMVVAEESTEKMISAVLTGVNRAFPFSKTDDLTLEKHMDTLFRITHSSNFNTSIQALMLIEQLATSKHLAIDRFYRTLYESLLDPRLVTSSKHALYLNLLFRALRSDLSVKRVKAFAKRLLQVVTLHQPPFICGVIYLLRELENTFPGLKSLLKDAEDSGDEDDETFRDSSADGGPHAGKPDPQKTRNDVYDGRKRDPEHSNADKTCLWESIPFLVHFHPSVSLFASRLVSEEKMPPKPDLASHTLSSFLDRFVYRNAKAAAGGPKGSSIMQPLSGCESRGILLSNRSNNGHDPVNTEAFWRKKSEDVAVEDVFFHNYFSRIGKAKQASTKKKSVSRTAAEDGEDSEGEDEIWQALVDSRPEVEGENDDSDLEMLDLDGSDDQEIGGVDIESAGDTADWMDEEDGETSSASDGTEGSDLDELFSKELEKAEQPNEGEAGKDAETSRQKRRRLKDLPTFASAEDYAQMLDNNEDEDDGF